MSEPTSTAQVEEYRALRATINVRSTLRLSVAALTFLAWAAIAALIEWSGARPAASVAALLVLVSGFEVVFAAHVGVERIGRYIQVRYETGAADAPAWEQTAMRLGREPGASLSIDPLFFLLFGLATLVNLAMLTPVAAFFVGTPLSGTFSLESILACAIHAGFLIRLVLARRVAQTQRIRDLALFTRILDRTPPS